MRVLPLTPALATAVLVAIPVFGGSAPTYTGRGEIPANRNLAAAAIDEPVVAVGDF
ncbi:MAG TPA: hypothetical protein VF554_14965 [Thermoanaerobaculia bacterium]|jgi:hypothetical protein